MHGLTIQRMALINVQQPPRNVRATTARLRRAGFLKKQLQYLDELFAYMQHCLGLPETLPSI